jgi:hypothetical protein
MWTGSLARLDECIEDLSSEKAGGSCYFASPWKGPLFHFSPGKATSESRLILSLTQA